MDQAFLGAVGVVWSELSRHLWHTRGIAAPSEEEGTALARGWRQPRVEFLLVVGLVLVGAAIAGVLAVGRLGALFIGFGVPAGPRGLIRYLKMLAQLRTRGGGFPDPEETLPSEFDERSPSLRDRLRALADSFVA